MTALSSQLVLTEQRAALEEDGLDMLEELIGRAETEQDAAEAHFRHVSERYPCGEVHSADVDRLWDAEGFGQEFAALLRRQTERRTELDRDIRTATALLDPVTARQPPN